MSRKNNKAKIRRFHAATQKSEEERRKRIRANIDKQVEDVEENGQIVDQLDADMIDDSEDEIENNNQDGMDIETDKPAPMQKKIKKKNRLLQRRVVMQEKKRARKIRSGPILVSRSNMKTE